MTDSRLPRTAAWLTLALITGSCGDDPTTSLSAPKDDAGSRSGVQPDGDGPGDTNSEDADDDTADDDTADDDTADDDTADDDTADDDTADDDTADDDTADDGVSADDDTASADAGVAVRACAQCTEMRCPAQLEACADPVNDGSLPEGQTGNRCEAAVECMQTPLPSGDYCITLDGDQSPLSCICPNGVDAVECGGLDPAYLTEERFACLPTLRRAAVPGSGTGDPPGTMLTILFNFADPEMAIGDAMAVIACQLEECPSCEHVQVD